MIRLDTLNPKLRQMWNPHWFPYENHLPFGRLSTVTLPWADKLGNFDVQEVEDAVSPRQTSPGREHDSKDLETDINLGIWLYHGYIMVVSWLYHRDIMVIYPHVSTSKYRNTIFLKSAAKLVWCRTRRHDGPRGHMFLQRSWRSWKLSRFLEEFTLW